MLSPRLLETLRDYRRRARAAGEWLFPGRHLSRDTPEWNLLKPRP